MAKVRMPVMSLTEAAAARVRDLMAKAGRPVAGLRVGVRNGGCAGMAYTMELADEAAALDEVVEHEGAKVIVDAKALMFLLGAQMDFQTTKMQSSFVFNNPNQTDACGCGESVALTPVDQSRLESLRA